MAKKISLKKRLFYYNFFRRFIWFDKRPRAMRYRNRAICNSFGSSELLYFRCFNDEVKPDEKPHSSVLNVPDQSTNRSGLGGRFWFVLLPDEDFDEARTIRRLSMGVYSIPASIFPLPANLNGKLINFRVEHDPREDNYQHSEIRAYSGPQRLVEKEITGVKKAYREVLAEKSILELCPEIKRSRTN